ncbi:hypothetical protein FSP39_015710 [Pinctada imbricata]|uniref:Reverse transcriptase n=1 Tax=Pinctada imbricata TaxID=66713 RepID=A0AA88YV02_PINIB|nr:hypothetical protein FSP39_015710 [Pinctada imbricata]
MQQPDLSANSDDQSTSTPKGGKRKSVRFKPDDLDRKYDLSPFLNRDDNRSPSTGNITTRRRPSTTQGSTTRASTQSTNDQRKDVPKIKPATYDGSTSWLDYKSHFEACATLCKWSYTEKGLFLSVSLRGLAQGVLGNLSAATQMDYDQLVTALNDRFAPPDQMELYRIQLRERRQKASESLPELAQHVRRLTNLAYPTVQADVKETLAKDQFIDALIDSDLRLRIKQARPKSLNDAVRHAVELEAYMKAENKIIETKGMLKTVVTEETTPSPMDELQKMVSELSKSMKDMKAQLSQLKDKKGRPDKPFHRNKPRSRDWKKDAECYNCGRKGHIMRECREEKNGRAKDKKDKPYFGAGKQSHIKSKVGYNIDKGEAGIFIEALIQGLEAHLLIDTGATLSLISEKVYNNISSTPGIAPLQEVKRKVLTANNEPLKIIGLTTVSITVAGKSYSTPVLVADVSVEGVIGLDFMKENSCAIDICNQNMTLSGNTVPLITQGHIGVFKIALADTVRIPPRSEIITRGNICLSEHVKLSGEGLIEPDEMFLSSEKGLVGKALVTMDGQVPLRIMNVSEDMKVINARTVVATVSQAEAVKDVQTPNENIHQDTSLPESVQDLLSRSSKQLSNKQTKELRTLLQQYVSVFSKGDKDFGRTDLVKHPINTGSKAPIKQRLRRTPVHLDGVVEEHLDDMLKRDVIEPSTSPWASAIVLARKKDGTTRFCVDYRKLNDSTIKDAFPLPRIDETLDHLAGACWFSTLDLSSGYWQVTVEPQDRPKTAFITKRGLYQFKVMPFGLCNAPATFERLMESVLNGLQWDTCLVYLDDIIVLGKSFDAMVQNLKKVFDRLISAGLKLKAKKCTLFAEKVDYLGHVVSKEGISTDPNKIATVEKWLEPTNAKEVRSFLGFCSYYRRFIKSFASIAKPLHKLANSNKFQWTEDCQNAFNLLKRKLIESPILAYPNFTETFILDTDASDKGIGAVLSQNIDGNERVIAYASRTLSKAEQKYCVTRKELLAVVHYVKYFRHYLYGRQFRIRTDHGSLRWLINFKNPEGQLARWIEVLGMYDMKIEHRPGSQHRNADTLSRYPCKQCKYDPDWEQQKSNETHVKSVSMVNTEETMVKQDNSIEPDTGLIEIQREDKEISTVRRWIEEKHKPTQNELSSAGPMIKALWSQRDMLVITNDLLYRNWSDHKGKTLQAIVPFKERRKVLDLSHDHKTAGHLGITKTLSKIRQRYYWPGLQRDVRQYISACDICTMSKKATKRERAPMQILGSGAPMERIALDIVGELSPTTQRGNKYILVISDYFTKWVEAFAMPNMEAITVAEILVKEVIARYGVPSTVHSDQGKQFEGKVFSEMCSVLNIDKTRTTPYHPQSDGMVERFNKTLLTMLRTLVDENQSNWDDLLPYVLMAYRSVEQETTGSSPNYLMMGREVATPLDLMYEMPASVKPIPPNQWAWELKERVETAHSFVRQHSSGAMLRQKTLHDRKLNWNKFKPDDEVYVYFPRHAPGHSPKLTKYWRGPFKILEKCSDITYKVDCGPRGMPQMIHVDRLRLKKKQILTHEKSEQDHPVSDSPPSSESFNEESGSKLPPNTESALPGKRVRKSPRYLSDYET